MKLFHLAVAGALAIGAAALTPSQAEAFSGVVTTGGFETRAEIVPAGYWDRRGWGHRRHYRHHHYPRYSYYYARPRYHYPSRYYYRHRYYRPGLSLNFRFD